MITKIKLSELAKERLKQCGTNLEIARNKFREEAETILAGEINAIFDNYEKGIITEDSRSVTISKQGLHYSEVTKIMGDLIDYENLPKELDIVYRNGKTLGDGNIMVIIKFNYKGWN